MSRLHELQECRAYACRLTPDRALQSLEAAEEFLLDRGLLTRTADCALPSLFEACHEDPYAPASPGFGQWPATKWPWFGELGERGYTILKVHRGKSVLVTAEVATLLDPICRSELERMEREPDSKRLLSHLAEAGPSAIEDLLVELELRPKELKELRSPLERIGAVVSRSVVQATADGGHVHTSELARWDQAFPEPSGEAGGVDELVVAGVRAAVVAPESDVRKWFSWSWPPERNTVERLVTDGRLERPEPGWIALAEGE